MPMLQLVSPADIMHLAVEDTPGVFFRPILSMVTSPVQKLKKDGSMRRGFIIGWPMNYWLIVA